MSAIERTVEDTIRLASEVEKQYTKWFRGYLKIFLLRTIQWLFIYFCGYYNVSFGWLVAPLFFLILRDKRNKEKKVKFDIVRSIANSDEKEIITEIQKFSNLPSWVSFPDMERAEWVNKIMKQIWPYAGQYCKDLCRDIIEPAFQNVLKEYKMKDFRFEKIILGDTPARISGIKVYDNTSRDEIIMDADFVYAGDCKFEVSIRKVKGGIKDLQISGRIRIMMKPLVRQIPLVGGIQVFFLNNPDLDFNLIGIADVFDMPGLSDLLRKIVLDEIGNLMVLPNRFPIQLVDNINVVELKAPLPAGVLRIQVLEAKNLMKKDFAVLGMGKSDPYCVIRLGAQKFKTDTIKNNVNPVWNYCCEFVADSTSGQAVHFDLFDLDDGPNKDDPLGRVNLDVETIFSSGDVDMWVPLSDAKSGRIHIKASWLELSDNPDDLSRHKKEISDLQNLTENPLHTALIAVWIDSASKLNNIPDAFVRLRVANEQQETAVHMRTNDPVFEEGFKFLVRDPKTQDLLVEIFDQKTNQSQGLVNVVLHSLLSRNNMEIQETFPLQKSTGGGHSSIKMAITLKVFKSALQNVTSSKETTLVDFPVKVTPLEEVKLLTRSPKLVLKHPKDVQQTEEALQQESETAVKLETSKGTLLSKSEVAPISKQEMSPFPTPETAPILLPEVTPLLQPEIIDGSLRQRSTAGYYGIGRIKLTVKYQRCILSVIVHEVSNLPKEDDGEIPDPYVKVYLLTGRYKDSKRKTEVVKDSCNPKYNDAFEFTVQTDDMYEKNIKISVINKKGFFHMQKSAIMGVVQIDCRSLPEKEMEWFDLKPATIDDED